MTTSSIGSTRNPYQTSATDGFNQLFQDFSGIGSALQTGNLTTAQTALASFQSDLQSASGNNELSNLFNNNPTLNNDLTTLQNALTSNNASSAKTAFKTLLQDVQSAMKTQVAQRRHHHHHGINNFGNNPEQTAATSIMTGSASGTTDATALLSSVGSLLNVQA